jgi:hypothetical protein
MVKNTALPRGRVRRRSQPRRGLWIKRGRVSPEHGSDESRFNYLPSSRASFATRSLCSAPVIATFICEAISPSASRSVPATKWTGTGSNFLLGKPKEPHGQAGGQITCAVWRPARADIRGRPARTSEITLFSLPSVARREPASPWGSPGIPLQSIFISTAGSNSCLGKPKI